MRSREVIRIKHLAAYGTCNIAMGPDGYLYLAINDYETDSRDLSILGRKIQRLDIDKKDAGKEYAIPPDNPFVGDPGKRPEIWAYGFRNAWNMNFDALTGNLWLGDVGQKEVEEMNIVAKGRNYGWKNGGDFSSKSIDGFNEYCNKSPHGFVQERDCSQFQDPEYAFPREGNLAIACIAAGVTYRADPSSPFYGYHIFGDVNRNILVAHKKGETPHVIGDVNDFGGDGHNGI